MFQLPALPSIAGPLPHERDPERSQMNSSAPTPLKSGELSGRSARSARGSDASARSEAGRSGGKKSKSRRRSSSASMMSKSRPKKASDLMYLVPHDKEEAKQYKSVLVFCDVKLREGAARRRSTVDQGPDVAATAACCHAIDELCVHACPPAPAHAAPR